jgi:hypothetical protein
MYIDEEEINNNECVMCLKPFKHYKRYKTVEGEKIKELEFIINCVRCRNLLAKGKEILKQKDIIKQERTNREWAKFCNN